MNMLYYMYNEKKFKTWNNLRIYRFYIGRYN